MLFVGETATYVYYYIFNLFYVFQNKLYFLIKSRFINNYQLMYVGVFVRHVRETDQNNLIKIFIYFELMCVCMLSVTSEEHIRGTKLLSVGGEFN